MGMRVHVLMCEGGEGVRSRGYASKKACTFTAGSFQGCVHSPKGRAITCMELSRTRPPQFPQVSTSNQWFYEEEGKVALQILSRWLKKGEGDVMVYLTAGAWWAWRPRGTGAQTYACMQARNCNSMSQGQALSTQLS
eukprot:1002160-Pelagomonas_calceolata.AAC.3